MGVTDVCGPVESPLTSQLVAFPPGALSTYEFPYVPIGSVFENPLGEIYHGMFLRGVPSPKPLKIRDLQCPTFGVGTSTDPQGEILTTVGPPWLPVISPPPEILTLNPEWNRICMGNLTFNTNMQSLAIFDPPRVLVPGEGLVPDPHRPAEADPTAANVQQGPSPQPAQTPKPDLPIQTGGPSLPSAEDPHKASDRPGVPSDPKNNDPHSGNDGATVVGEPNNEPSPQNGQKPQDTSNDPPIPAPSIPANGNDPATSASVGRLILQGFGPSSSSDPSVPGSSASDSDAPEEEPKRPSGVAAPLEAGAPLAAGSVIFTPAPTGFVAGGETLLPQGTPATIAGTLISLAASNTLIVGTKTFSIDSSDLSRIDPDLDPGPGPGLIVGGNLFTVAASGFVIEGTTISPGAPAVTISGTLLSLDPSGVLVVGSKTVSLSSNSGPSRLSAPDLPPKITVGGEVFTGDAASLSIGGTRVLPGASAVTISGIRISLGPSGLLFVGSDTTSLPSGPTDADSGALTIAGQLITPNPSGFRLGTATVLPGSGGIVVGSESISLGTNGVLDIDGSAMTLVSPTWNGTGYPTVETGNGSVVAFTGSAKSLEWRLELLIIVVMWLWVYRDFL